MADDDPTLLIERIEQALKEPGTDKAKLRRAELTPRALERLVDQCRDAKERLNPSSRRITTAFTRFPLWAMATGPPSVVAQKGCALRSVLSPAVE